MTLPNVAKLQQIYAVKSSYTGTLAPLSSNTGWFWSSEEYSTNPQYIGRLVRFDNFDSGRADRSNKNAQGQVLCVAN